MIRRGFVSIDGRQAHYRVAGNGPPLVLIHQSPQNSRAWQGMMRRFADRYTVIAPDTPGFGYSDPLPPPAERMAEYGEATLALLDALAVSRFAVFGMHTGGLIAAWLAWAHPQRVAALVVDGYAAFDDEESALFGEAYLPPFVPQWDGSHLRWLWARMREQKYFFPWYDGRADAAMMIDPQTTQSTHDAVMDILAVGDSYRAGYGAAFRHREHHWPAELQVPAWLVYRAGDPLRAHLPRLQPLPGHVQVLEMPADPAAMHAAMDGWLATTLAREPAWQPPDHSAPLNDWHRRMVATPVGEMACWQRLGSGHLRVILHAPGSAVPPLQTVDIGNDACLIPELPGHGASSEMDAPLDRQTMHVALLAGIAASATDLPIVLEAHGAAAAYVPALVAALPGRVEKVVLQAPWLLDAEERAVLLEGLPRCTPDRSGGHLCDVWQWERERHLMWPWLLPTAAARRRVDAPDTGQVHANAVELLRLGERVPELFASAVYPELMDDLCRLPVPLHVRAEPADDHEGRGAALNDETLRSFADEP